MSHKPIDKIQANPLPGFEHVGRSWNKKAGRWHVTIKPGEVYISKEPETILTVLGSCISVCIYDSMNKIGGMNHFMLPEQGQHTKDIWGNNAKTSQFRYGNWAMEFLINEIIKNGGNRQYFKIKIFGGGQVSASMADIGQRNILFTYDFLKKENFTIEASDIGDVFPRKIKFDPISGKVLMKHIKVDENCLEKTERYHLDKLRAKTDDSNSGSIELF